jgi:hypothetical protein
MDQHPVGGGVGTDPALEQPTAARPLLEAALSTYERLACTSHQHAVQARLLALA